jgi:hypothetical protein
MPENKLKIDDSINIETHSSVRYDAAGEQRQKDEKFYVREKSLLETGTVYLIIGLGALAGIIIYFRIQSFHGKREKEMISAVEKRKENEKKKNSYISEINALRNSISEIKNTDVMKYSSAEVSESEAAVLESENELKKFNFSKVTELTKKAKDKLDYAVSNTKRITDENKEKELARQKEANEKKRAEEEKQKQAEKKKTESESKRKKEEALRQLQELEKMMKPK